VLNVLSRLLARLRAPFRRTQIVVKVYALDGVVLNVSQASALLNEIARVDAEVQAALKALDESHSETVH
jgi:hypothetical protein